MLRAAVIILCSALTARAAEAFHVSVRVDLGADVGRNFGSLFEVVDRSGKVCAGAGFLGAYNTQPRSSRRNLHFFVKARTFGFKVEPLPKPTADSGVYLDDFQGRLYARSRNGTDNRLRHWDGKEWRPDDDTPPYATEVGDGVLSVTQKALIWNGGPIFELNEQGGRFGEYYYASRKVFVRVLDREQQLWRNEIVAFDWMPGAPLKPVAAVLKLRSEREFVYAFGQLGGKVIAATNTGGVYEFDGEQWRCLIEPTAKSFQIYTIMNHRDRLWMGHYPTGNLFEYDGESVRRLAGVPPLWLGVLDRAREAQTLTIYGGDVYCGVWPWGEVWRFDANGKEWHPVQRMFTHPGVNDEYRHPYEAEMKQLGAKTLNLWGQRVTSMVPFGDSLYIGTSAKNAAPWNPRYSFLTEERVRDYGGAYRLKTPGHLTSFTKWVNGATTFQFDFQDGRLSLSQDGRTLGTAVAPDVSIDQPRIRVGEGVYGRLHGEIHTFSSTFR